MQTSFAGHFCRVQLPVMLFVVGFVTEQIAVGACPEETFIHIARLFAKRQGDSAIRIILTDGGDCFFYPVVRQGRVFPALQYKSTESQVITLLTAIQDTFHGQPVTFDIRVSFSDTAIITVIPAAVADLNQATDINLVSKVEQTYFPCLPVDGSQGFCVTFSQQLPEFFLPECPFLP